MIFLQWTHGLDPVLLSIYLGLYIAASRDFAY
jgi:hypothetical protein